MEWKTMLHMVGELMYLPACVVLGALAARAMVAADRRRDVAEAAKAKFRAAVVRNTADIAAIRSTLAKVEAKIAQK